MTRPVALTTPVQASPVNSEDEEKASGRVAFVSITEADRETIAPAQPPETPPAPAPKAIASVELPTDGSGYRLKRMDSSLVRPV